MRRFIKELTRQYRAEERRVAFLDRVMDQNRDAGQYCDTTGRSDRGGQVNARACALKRMADLNLALEALRALDSKDVRPVGRIAG